MSFGAIAGLAAVVLGTMMSAQSTTSADDRSQLEDIQQQLARPWVTRDRSTIERCQVDEVRVRMFEGFAIVTGRTHARGEYKGQKHDVTLRFTDVFVRRNQQWQAVASHASRIALTITGSAKVARAFHSSLFTRHCFSEPSPSISIFLAVISPLSARSPATEILVPICRS